MADWAGETAELIERGVGNVRDRVVVPAQSAVRVAIYGTLAGLVAVAMAVLTVVGSFHALVVLVNLATPGPDDNAWLAWLIVGGILLVVGGLLWSKRRTALS